MLGLRFSWGFLSLLKPLTAQHALTKLTTTSHISGWCKAFSNRVIIQRLQHRYIRILGKLDLIIQLRGI